MYAGLKHMHMLLVALSVGFLIVRAVWLLRGSPLLQQKWVKIVPHVVDTALLLAAIGMVHMMPWLSQPWLWEKLVLVVMYIGWGFYLFKFAKSAATQMAGLAGAITCVVAIVYLARTKVPFILG